jgi:ankyrin repeat protein
VNSPSKDDPQFRDAIQGLRRGDFSRLAPLFDGKDRFRILEWCGLGFFEDEPAALAEAFACACFLGQTNVAVFLLDQGVDPTAGDGTGMNGFHWAANRGNLATVEMLIQRAVPLEIRNSYGGTVLGTAVWSAIHESGPDHPAIIEALIRAGASLETVAYPTGDKRVDDVLRPRGPG